MEGGPSMYNMRNQNRLCFESYSTELSPAHSPANPDLSGAQDNDDVVVSDRVT